MDKIFEMLRKIPNIPRDTAGSFVRKLATLEICNSFVSELRCPVLNLFWLLYVYIVGGASGR